MESSDPTPVATQAGEGAKKTGELPQVEESRKKNVADWTKKIQNAKKNTWKDIFKFMRECMKFVKGVQWGKTPEESRKMYVANIVQRHAQQRVAALYAKDPRFVAKRRRSMDFRLWDGSQASLQSLQAQLMTVDPVTGAQVPNPNPPPGALALLQDISDGVAKRKLYQKIADTLEIVMSYSLDEQQPPFKRQMKQLVRRVVACSVGYVKIGYKRVMEPKPENVEKINDVTEKLKLLERLSGEMAAGDKDLQDKEADQLRTLLADLNNAEGVILSEGLTFDFPASTAIIIDPKCRQLSSFLGARWVAEEFILDVDEVKEIYGVDICAQYTAYTGPDDGTARQDTANPSPDATKGKKCCVWEVWDKHSQQVFTIAEGWIDFLREPATPDIQIRRFWPFFPLCFNEVEPDDTEPGSIFPQSDVELLMPMQREINRSREALREHRHANRPKTGSVKGQLDDEDKAKLTGSTPHAHLELNGLQPGQKITDVIMAIPNVPIDGALYDTAMFREDAFSVGGQSEASLGTAQSGTTATGDSIAESNRASFNGSSIDEMDDMLSELAEASGQILFLEMSPEKVTEIAGVGAIWPKLNLQQVADELMLDVKAGSSGRPNKAAEVDNFQKLAPVLQQIPGISPAWLAQLGIKVLDEDVDLESALAEGLQSMVAMNSMKGPMMGGDAVGAPQAQGAQGGMNGPQPPASPQNPGAHQLNPGAVLAAQ